jgi:ribonucleoside-diphosphate reductase alpha chain
MSPSRASFGADPNRPDYDYMNEVSLNMLSNGYLTPNIPREGLRHAAEARGEAIVDRLEELAKRKLPTVRIGMRRGWFSPSSPVWANLGKTTGLPISCNGSFMADRTSSILMKTAEIGQMSKLGAGTSLYMGALRPFGTPISGGGFSDGPTKFARLVQEHVTIISQGSTRRGNCAVFLDIEHPDIHNWMKFRNKEEGKEDPIQHLQFGVCISRQWWADMKLEPKDGTGAKREMVKLIRNKRRETGFPYIFFTDNANDVRPQVLKDKGLLIAATNLCTEIMNHSTPDESFVCCLLSLNLLYRDEWKNTDFVYEATFALDAMLTEYIEKLEAMAVTDPDGYILMKSALNFAKRWRSLGLGVLGYHSLLQSKMIPFESPEARALNIEIFSHIQAESDRASRDMAMIYGEPEGMEGTGYRNINRQAVAPTTSSSIINGGGLVSQSIEPWEANIFENDNAKSSFVVQNPQLRALLKTKGLDTPETWSEIAKNGGSIQYLDYFSDHEKMVFKTRSEINQKEIILQAGNKEGRGLHIDQGQSINIILPPEATMKDDFEIMDMAEEHGLKSMYYRHGLNEAQILARDACLACSA